MKNELLKIGPFTVYGYGLMIAIGIIAAYLVGEYRAKKENLDSEKIFSLTLWALLGGFAGSKLLYIATRFKEILENPGVIVNLSDGFVVYGGIIGGIIAGIIYCGVKKLSFFKYFDLLIPSVALAQGFGRIGCFLAGCCYGRETSCGIGIVFKNSMFAPNGVKLLPTQLISSGLDFLLFFVLILFNKKKSKDGQTAGMYLVLYSIGRFVLEFYRGDLIRGTVGSLTTSQFISIFTCIAGILLFVVRRGKKVQENEEEA